MTQAGPAAAMAALLPTNRPAPMMPPIVIIDTCRGRRDRLRECSSAVAVAALSFMGGRLRGAGWRKHRGYTMRRRRAAGSTISAAGPPAGSHGTAGGAAHGGRRTV